MLPRMVSRTCTAAASPRLSVNAVKPDTSTNAKVRCTRVTPPILTTSLTGRTLAGDRVERDAERHRDPFVRRLP